MFPMPSPGSLRPAVEHRGDGMAFHALVMSQSLDQSLAGLPEFHLLEPAQFRGLLNKVISVNGEEHGECLKCLKCAEVPKVTKAKNQIDKNLSEDFDHCQDNKFRGSKGPRAEVRKLLTAEHFRLTTCA